MASENEVNVLRVCGFCKKPKFAEGCSISDSQKYCWCASHPIIQLYLLGGNTESIIAQIELFKIDIASIVDEDGKSLLSHAASNNDTVMIKFLCDNERLRDDDINGLCTFGYTPLACAAMNRSNEAIKLLLENKADPYITYNSKSLEELYKESYHPLPEFMIPMHDLENLRNWIIETSRCEIKPAK